MIKQKRTGILSRVWGGKCISFALTLMLTLAAFLLPSNAMADEPWVEYHYNTNELIFKYGAEKPESSDTVKVYNLNEGSNSREWTSNATSVVFDKSFANARPTTCYGWFSWFRQLKSIEGLEYLNTEQVTDMSYMFNHCSSLESINLASFNTANVTNMSYMFQNCSALKSLDLSRFNTQKVTDMSEMFNECPSLESINLASFNTENVTSMYMMFYKCSSLKSLNLSSFNTANVTKMSDMFGSCSSLENLDISSFNTANVTGMGYMFDKCSTLKKLDLSHFNTAKVTSMSCMFRSCKALENLDISSFNTENVTDMSYMFEDCSALESLDLSSFNTANVTNMSYMFQNCSALESLDLSSFNTANVTNMNSMFYGCTALTTILVNQFDIKENSYTQYMFKGCTSLVGASSYNAGNTGGTMANYTTGYFTKKEPWAEYDSSNQTLTFNYGKKPKSSGTVTVYGLNEGNNSPEWSGNTCTTVVFDKSFADVRPTTCYGWFYNQQELTTIEGLQYLNTEEVTDMSSMFYGCSSLTNLDVSKFSTTNMTNMSNMFYGCGALTSLDLSNFNTGNVENMSGMFSGCSGLGSLDLSSFSTEKVTDMSSMFYGCGASSIVLTSFNTANVTNMSNMFYGCSSLTNLDVSNFSTENVTSMAGMFSGCNSLTTLDLATFNTAKVTTMGSMFAACSNLTTIYTSDTFVTSGLTDSSAGLDMFKDCTSLVGAASYNASNTDATMANFKTGYFTLTPKATAYAEYDSSTQKLTFKYDLKPESSDTVTVYELNEGDNSPKWSGKTCTTVVFDESFSYARPTTCHAWFHLQENLTNIEGLQYLNTENVTNMSDMFSVCSALRNLDLSNFNTANVTDMDCMFYYCNALTTIYASGKFDITKINSCVAMFEGCTSLVGAVSYDENKTDGSMANYKTGYFTLTPKATAYAEYDSSTQKLTFKYDLRPESSGTVTVYGLNEGYENPGWYNNTTCKSVVFDESFSKARPTTCCSWFLEQRKLTNIEGLQYLNTENVTNMVEMFACCSALENLDLSNFNTEKVTNMSGMFEECYSLKTLDLSSFNTANVTEMKCMFYYCTALETLDLSNFNTANVTDMSCMFYRCSALNTIYVSDKFDITKVNSSVIMFEGCNSLVGAVKYDSNYTDANMANYTTGYFTYDKEAWVEYDSNTQKLTFMYGRYDKKPESSGTVTVYGLNEGDNIPEWNNNTYTSVVFDKSFSDARPTTCFAWFYNQQKLTNIEGLQYLNTENVTDMRDMFGGCYALTTLDLSNFNTAKVTTMGSMFAACSNLTTIYTSGTFVTSGLTDSSAGLDMFKDCASLVGAVSYDANNTSATMANYKTGYFTLTPKATAYAEYDSSTQTLTFKYDLKPESSGTVTVYGLNDEYDAPGWYNNTTCTSVVFDESFSKARPTTCTFWFNEQYNLTSIEGLKYLNTEKVTKMNSMFNRCYSLENLDLSYFNTANVTNMYDMFSYCSALTTLDLSKFNTANVTVMSGMFSDCSALTTLDLSKFNTANVREMGYMFDGCSALTNIYVSDKFDINKVEYSSSMFSGCTSLVGAVPYDKNNIDVTMANYKTGYFKTYYIIDDTKHDLCGETLSVTDLVLEDGKDFVALAPFTANTASYSRTMTSNWGTLCLPFAVETTSTADCKFYGIESVDNDVITLSQLDGTIAAGTPVLIYSTTELNIAASNVDVVTAPAEGAQASGWQLVGSFAETEVPDDGYIISKNKFWLTSDLKNNASVKAVKTKGLRAWLKSGSDSSEAKAHVLGFAFNDENETSAIEAIDGLTEGTAEIYDMQGRRIDHLQKGLNIIKTGNVTKKVMVK